MSKASALAVAGLGLLLSACQVVGPDYHLPGEAAVHRDDFQAIWRRATKMSSRRRCPAIGGACIRTRVWTNWCSRPWLQH